MFVVLTFNSWLFGGRHGTVPRAEPFRDELLSIERLEERARALADRFTMDPFRRVARSVSPRFDENGRLLRHAYRVFAADVHRGEFITPGSSFDSGAFVALL